MELQYFSDKERHLVCVPYTLENLHRMADDLLGPNMRHWFHMGKNKPHYDIPKKRLEEIASKTTVITKQGIWNIIKDGRPNLYKIDKEKLR